MRALNTIGPRGPRIAFATSRKGPQVRLLAYTPRRETQPVLWADNPSCLGELLNCDHPTLDRSFE